MNWTELFGVAAVVVAAGTEIETGGAEIFGVNEAVAADGKSLVPGPSFMTG